MIALRLRPQHTLALTVLLHAGLLYAVLQESRRTREHQPRGPAIQWLLAPSAPSAARQPARPLPASAPVRVQVRVPVPTVPPAQRPDNAPALSTPEPATPGTADDPFAPAAARVPVPASASDLLQRARHDAGRIDKELRAAFPQRMPLPLPPPDSMQVRLERGINAAHDAVPPKWYQGARMVELTTADGERKTRTYKIITAIGAYCIHINPEGRRSYTSCP